MHYPFYTATPVSDCCTSPVDLPSAPQLVPQGTEGFQADKDYLPDPGLVDAVNTALLLGQPLLITGEPGSGKTQLAYHLACQLGYPVLRFDTKSTTQARDLFYSYDVLGRFQAMQGHEVRKRPQDYLTFQALGLAILLANEESQVEPFLPADFEPHVHRLLGEQFVFHRPQRSIVLIDEIDKAPRDVPNDILNEVENAYFRIPELGTLGTQMIQAPVECKPILILTSNLEKPLPETFLRRCIYYHLPFPEEARLREIVDIRLAKYTGIHNFLADALQLFLKLRGGGLRKKPSTAELLNWLLVLRELFKEETHPHPLVEEPEKTLRSFSTLVKTVEDQKIAEGVLMQWREERRKR